MSHSFWTGAIHFGLVNIPVTMHPASESVDLDFDLVDVRDFSPVGYLKVNKNTGKEVPRDKIVKTFKIEEGEAVVVTEADFARARPKGTRSLEISGFLKLAEIPPAFFDTPYYLEPAGKDAHAYALFRETLAKSGKAALARGVLRTRERLGALYADGEFLMFNTLRYAHEMRKRETTEVLTRAKAGTKAETSMAEQLIAGMAMTWKPGQFRDEYHDDLVSYIKKKAKAGEGRKIYEPEKDGGVEEAAPADLMRLLKESLATKGGPKTPRKRRSAS